MELRVTQYLSTSAASPIGIAARALYSSVMSVLGKSANKAALIQAATDNDWKTVNDLWVKDMPAYAKLVMQNWYKFAAKAGVEHGAGMSESAVGGGWSKLTAHIMGSIKTADENKALSKLVQAGDEQALLAALTAAFSV